MDGATLQARIYKGRGRAAQYIGQPCDIYRPNNPSSPFSNQIARLNVALNAADQKYLKPNLYNKPVWFADCDGRKLQTGDYIVRISDGATWFIAAMQQLLPIVAIDCNASVKVRRQAPSTTFGAEPYSGIIAPSYILGTVDSPWPASILMGTRALAAVGLPADVKEAAWRVLLPSSVPLTLLAGDRLDDDKARSYWADSAELTDMGWRIAVNEAHA
jgi:hypothetical protein